MRRGGRAAAAATPRRCCMPRARPPPHGVQVLALHVHHGLSPMPTNGSRTAAQCTALGPAGCRCSLHWRGYEAGRRRQHRGLGPARRYAALAAMARACGAARCCWPTTVTTRPRRFCCRRCAAPVPAGLAAMPREIERDGSPGRGPGCNQPAPRSTPMSRATA